MKRIKSILIVGGTGVLSSAVVAEALSKNMDVTIITRGKRQLPQGVTSIICDKDDYTQLSRLLNGKNFDAIIDFLCYHVDELERSFTFYSNYTKQYFFISSCAVYDTRVGGVCIEDSPKVLPMWSYSMEKWEAEKKLAELASATSCKYTVVRPCVTYGDTRIPYGISPQYGYHWTLCARILAEKPIIIWNNGENCCNMMRVEDFAVGVVGLVGNEKAYNEAFNICGDETPSWREVLTIVEDYLHKKAITINLSSEFYAQQLPKRAGEILGGRSIDSINNNGKIKAVVPEFKQSIHIRDGIYMTLDAYKSYNYQHGIDWQFDAETDRAIRNWCKENHMTRNKYNVGFTDYLDSASIVDRWQYYQVLFRDSIFVKAVNKLLRIKRKILHGRGR